MILPVRTDAEVRLDVDGAFARKMLLENCEDHFGDGCLIARVWFNGSPRTAFSRVLIDEPPARL